MSWLCIKSSVIVKMPMCFPLELDTCLVILSRIRIKPDVLFSILLTLYFLITSYSTPFLKINIKPIYSLKSLKTFYIRIPPHCVWSHISNNLTSTSEPLLLNLSFRLLQVNIFPFIILSIFIVLFRLLHFLLFCRSWHLWPQL